MKKYEAPSYEVEYFTIKNDIMTTSENPENEIIGLNDDYPVNEAEVF